MLSYIQSWQPMIGSFLGLITIFLAATLGFRFNRRRDDYLKQEEIKSIATALYAEIVMLRPYAAKMVNFVSKRYEDNALGTGTDKPFDAHFFEMVPMPDPVIYAGLSSKIGILSANLVLGIVQFYSLYREASYWLPYLEEKEDRGYSYSVLCVLKPGISAVEGIQSTLQGIEILANISPSTEIPDLKYAKRVANWEEEQWAEILEQRA